MEKKLTKARIKRLMKDEEKGMKEYRELGLDNLASDEHGHYNYLKGLLVEGFFRGKKIPEK